MEAEQAGVETSTSVSREVPVRDRAGDDELLQDAIDALDDVALVRFQVTHDGIGARDKFVRFAYVFKNLSKRSHSVVPLIPMSHRIHHNMKVLDERDGHLILMDSEFCRRAVAGYAERVWARLRELVGQHSALHRKATLADFESEVSLSLVRKAFGSRYRDGPRGETRLSRKELAEREAEVAATLKDLESRVRHFVARFPVEERKDAVADATRTPYHAGLHRLLLASADLLWAIELRSRAFIPFVLLAHPLRPATEQASESYVFLRQVALRDVRPLFSPAAEGGGAPAPAQRSWVPPNRLLKYVPRPLIELFGVSGALLEFPLAVETRSYHLRVVGAKGIHLSHKIEAENIEDSRFQDDNNGDRFLSHVETSVYIYRFGHYIQDYETETKAKAAADPAYEPLAGTLWLRVWFRESPAVTILFLLGVLSALLVGVSPAAFGTPTAALAGALIVRSMDRPFSQRVLFARLLLLAVVAGLTATLRLGVRGVLSLLGMAP